MDDAERLAEAQPRLRERGRARAPGLHERGEIGVVRVPRFGQIRISYLGLGVPKSRHPGAKVKPLPPVPN